MLDLPPIAIAAILVVLGCGVLAMLQALACQIRNEVETHALLVRVAKARNRHLCERAGVPEPDDAQGAEPIEADVVATDWAGPTEADDRARAAA
jgi:hypothetical protein